MVAADRLAGATLFTTPVIYLGFDSLARRLEARRQRREAQQAAAD
jgi:hypothetical protein